MNSKSRDLAIVSILMLLTLFATSQTSGQTQNATAAIFKNAQEVYAACGKGDYDERRGAAILVNRLSDSAIEVFVAAGSTRKFQSLPAIAKLEIYVQPLRVIGKIPVRTRGRVPVMSRGIIWKTTAFFETGQPAYLSTSPKSFGEGITEIIITPKITMPVEKQAQAVRVRLNGLFEKGRVLTLTAFIDGKNTASRCGMSTYPPKK
ncbi:MAG: hypothetical protein HKN25_06790 [Pyrinomonadaceae bacterium]|nr:hypothetical protein [Pyrinomonadaceae bacterium]